jgi:hypothetical protein
VDRRQAQRENLKMRVVTEENMQEHMKQWSLRNEELQKDVDDGVQLDPPLIIPIHTYDNHRIHIEEHNLYRKGQSFENAPELVKMIFEEHVRQHEEAVLLAAIPSPLESPDTSMEEMEEGGNPPGPIPFPEEHPDTPGIEGAV